jgi:glycosyltransferase involved in cell wall biosynthesis
MIRRRGLPLVFWQHEPGGREKFHDKVGAWTPPDLVIANSEFTAGSSALRFPSVPVEVIYCPVPAPPASGPEVRDEVRRELGTAPETVVLLQASRLDRLKGTHVLIEALGGLADVPGWAFWLAGGIQRAPDRAYRDELEARAEALGIAGRVRFLGSRTDVPRLLAAADVYCQANVGPESFGIALVEALDAGVPVVTSRLGGAVEVIDASCGELLPAGDVPALRDALAGLIADPARRRALGDAGPARARRLCDPSATLGRLAEVLGRRPVSQIAART